MTSALAAAASEDWSPPRVNTSFVSRDPKQDDDDDDVWPQHLPLYLHAECNYLKCSRNAEKPPKTLKAL